MEKNFTSIPAQMHVGSFAGHAIPGGVFLLVSLVNSVHLYHHYFTARAHNEAYKATHAHPYWFWHKKKAKLQQTEALFRILWILCGIIGEIISSYKADLHIFTNRIMHAEHITMFGAFGCSAVIDVLTYHKSSCLPEGSDYFCGFGALLVEFLLFLYHLHGRSLLNTHLHTLLIFTIGFSAVATITEFVFRDKFIWSLPRSFLLWLQGTWFFQIAFILFNPSRDSPALDINDSESVMISTLSYAGHILIAFAVQFMIGGTVYLCHGRPKPKPHAYSRLPEIASSHSSMSPISTSRHESDEEVWEETSKLIDVLPQ